MKIEDISEEEVNSLLKRTKDRALDDKDYVLITKILTTVLYIYSVINQKSSIIKKLLKMIFGKKSEKSKDVLDDKVNQSDKANQTDEAEGSPEMSAKKPANGHGRNGADKFKGAGRVKVPNATLSRGDICPQCTKGKLYDVRPQIIVRIVGRAPVDATVIELECLRCNLCGVVFKSEAPGGIGDKKYDETAGAMVALLKYGSGVPFYRLEKLQESLGIPPSGLNAMGYSKRRWE